MDIWFDLALLAHLLALMAAGVAVVAMPVIGRRMAAATPELRASLGDILGQLGKASGIAFLVLLISGPLLLWLRYGGIGGASAWFWVKMALIVVIAASMAISGPFRKRAMTGDRQARKIVAVGTMISRASLVGVIIAAVLAFN